MKDVISRIKDKFAERILEFYEHNPLRIYIGFDPKDIPEAARFIFRDIGARFVIASGTDTPQGIEILYHFSHDATGKMISLRTLIADKKHPQITSITPIIRGAEWIEREMWELLGIDFEGHPNLTHLLLVDDWPKGKYPLRHDQDKD
ncbi:NADH-quinone oxidoreductase subunit C [Candidatus Omnitrophota bacterium]